MASAGVASETALAAASPRRRALTTHAPTALKIVVLMAPKTGSEFLISSMKSAYPSPSYSEHKVPTKLYTPCSVVSLRDPCQRLHS